MSEPATGEGPQPPKWLMQRRPAAALPRDEVAPASVIVASKEPASPPVPEAAKPQPSSPPREAIDAAVVKPLSEVAAPARSGGGLWNLLIGAVLGAAVAATGTVAAVRSPAVQERLGIVRADTVKLAVRGTDPNACPPAPLVPDWAGIGRTEMFFNRQRLRSVPP